MVESKKTQFIAAAVLILGLLIMAKAVSAGVNQMIVSDAIFAYQMDCIEEHRSFYVTYDNKESFTETMNRWWDWGYTRILDKYSYPYVEPYIGR